MANIEQNRKLMVENMKKMKSTLNESKTIKRFVIKHKKKEKYASGSGKYIEWRDASKADLYKGKFSSFWWDDDTMELIPVKISIP